MFGHFTKSMEPNLWCSCNTYLNSGHNDSLTFWRCFKTLYVEIDFIVLIFKPMYLSLLYLSEVMRDLSAMW